MSDYTDEVATILREHTIECTGRGEVTCHGCREARWMSWHAYRKHVAALVAEVIARAKAEAWDEGREAMHDRPLGGLVDDDEHRESNPYRAAGPTTDQEA